MNSFVYNGFLEFSFSNNMWITFRNVDNFRKWIGCFHRTPQDFLALLRCFIHKNHYFLTGFSTD